MDLVSFGEDDDTEVYPARKTCSLYNDARGKKTLRLLPPDLLSKLIGTSYATWETCDLMYLRENRWMDRPPSYLVML